MRIALLIAVLIATDAAPQQGEPIDRVLGAWQGTVEHAGESRDIPKIFVAGLDGVLYGFLQ